MTPSDSMTWVRTSTISHAAALWRSAEPPFSSVSFATSLARSVTGAKLLGMMIPSAAFEQPLPSAMATLTVEEWLDQPHIDVLNPGPAHMRIWGDLIRATNASGNLVNDAHIAAIAIEHDAEVHTNDRDFARFPGLRWSNPLQTLA